MVIYITVAIVGCGTSGTTIAAQIATNDMFDKITLIDFDIQKIKRLISKLKRINNAIEYTPQKSNVTKIKDVQKSLKEVTVLINAASPLCNIPLMKACLYSNTHYIDLASDPFCYAGITKGTTLDEQLKLNKEFKEKDLVAVTNTGFSPGFTDIISKHVVTERALDVLEYVKIFFAETIESKKFVVSWSPYIFLLEIICPSTVYEKGKIVYLDSEKSSKVITFPDPVGKIKIRPFNGHPELRTIPEFIGIPVEYVEISGGMRLNNMELNDIIVEALRKKVNDSVIFKGDVIEKLSSSFEPPDMFAELYKEGIIKSEVASCIIQIKGKKNNENIVYNAIIKHDIKDTIKTIPSSVSAFFVSFIPSIIANEINLGKIKERGVIAPAALSTASHIIYECNKMGMNIKESYK